MKKLMRKLVLSSFALGLAVITLSTTTFAWYTSNTTVGVETIQGTSSASGDSLLMISLTGEDGSFHNTVDSELNVTTLLPVQYNHSTTGNPEWAKLGENDTTTAQGGATNTMYIKEELYFRGVETKDTVAGVPVYLKGLSLTNNTVTLPKKDVLTTAGLPDWDLNAHKTYTVDILRTINIAYVVYDGRPNEEGTGYEYTYKLSGVLNPEALVDIHTEDSLKDVANFNAHTYFNEVTGRNIGSTNPLTGASYVKDLAVGDKVNFGSTPASLATYNALKIDFYIFINGWDLACFDAVQGQSISLSMTFSSLTTTTVTKGIA